MRAMEVQTERIEEAAHDVDDSILVDVDENETPESVAHQISEAKQRRDGKELKVLRAKERKVLMKEVERLRAKQTTEEKVEPKVEEKLIEEVKQKIEEVKEDANLSSTQKTQATRPQLLKKSAVLKHPGLSPTKTVTNLHTTTKPEMLKVPEMLKHKTDLK